MAERRMFAKSIIDSDAFLDMPASTQVLYFHLSMRADDDGFINNPKRIERMVGCSDDDMKILLAKHFIIAFDTGVVVIKHWRIHNYIQKDRYKKTAYEDEMAQLSVKKNGAYTLQEPQEMTVLLTGPEPDQDRIQDGYKMDTQVRLGKERLDKVSIETDTAEAAPANDDRFDRFWTAYPKKVGKDAARKAFKKVKAPIKTILDAIEDQKTWDQWKTENGRFIPNPATWLNQGRWQDERPDGVKPAQQYAYNQDDLAFMQAYLARDKEA